jgi:hypothetical protein
MTPHPRVWFLGSRFFSRRRFLASQKLTTLLFMPPDEDIYHYEAFPFDSISCLFDLGVSTE